MANVFIDAGSYTGDTAKAFLRNRQDGSSFDIYCIEANNVFYPYYDNLNVKLIKKACWTYDGMINFYVGHPLSSSLIRDKKTGNLDVNNPHTVECFDFSKWIKNTFDNEDYLVIKMDIEGAEYSILEQMAVDASIQLADELYVEWHRKKIGILKERHNCIIGKLEMLGIIPKPWPYGC